MTREELRSALDLSRRAGVLRVRNVLNPLLWLTAAVMPACFVAGGVIGYQTVLGVAVTLAGLVPGLFSLIFYTVFAFRDPDRLQSEEFVMRSMELRVYERRQEIVASLDGATRTIVPPPPDTMTEDQP
jgi:hypothetical protein